jgi:X-Pro dipeptidyl-peptidase
MLGAPAVTVAVFTAVAVPAGVSKVPVIMEPSPYWAGTLDIPNHGVDIDGDGLDDVTGKRYSTPPGSGRHSDSKITPELLGGTPETRAAQVARAAQVWSGYYDNYFLPRGYAVAQVDSIGSGGSTGCPTIGDRNETLGVKAAVDWLTGDAKGRDESDNRVTADWSTGRVALQGISYNGPGVLAQTPAAK